LKILVRFFAIYRERAGVSKKVFQMPPDSSVLDLINALRNQYPNLAPSDVQIVVAVNNEYASQQFVLKNDDEVALIPPVSGGQS
jgi:molybdopterin converting factor subunit 1